MAGGCTWPSEETTPPRRACVASLGQRRKVTSFTVLTAPLLRIQGLCEARSTSGSPGRNWSISLRKLQITLLTWWLRAPGRAEQRLPGLVMAPARPCVPCTAYCWVQGGPAQPDLKGRNRGPSPNASSQPRGSLSVRVQLKTPEIHPALHCVLSRIW